MIDWSKQIAASIDRLDRLQAALEGDTSTSIKDIAEEGKLSAYRAELMFAAYYADKGMKQDPNTQNPNGKG